MSKRNYIHAKAESHKEDGAWYAEYDQYGRAVFVRDTHGYWTMKFYSEPQKGEMPQLRPYEVVHKYWELYHAYRSTEVITKGEHIEL